MSTGTALPYLYLLLRLSPSHGHMELQSRLLPTKRLYAFPVSRMHSTWLIHNRPGLITLMLCGQHLHVLFLFTVTTETLSAVPSPRSPNIYSSPRSVTYRFLVLWPFSVGPPLPSVFPSILCCASYAYCTAHAVSESISSVRFIERKQGLFTVLHVFWMNPRYYCKQQCWSVSTIRTSIRGSCVRSNLFPHAHLQHARPSDQMSSVFARVWIVKRVN
jgi:hypothetical protein